jgi:hypothetical protein
VAPGICLHVGGALVFAEVPGHDAGCRLEDLLVDELRHAADLHAAERLLGLGHDDRRPRVTPQVSCLHVLFRDPHVEPTISPFVTDRR